MRRDRAIVSLVSSAALAVALVAAPASAGSKAPVKLRGSVNNEGVGKVVDGTIAVEVDNFSFDKTFLKTSPGEVQVELTNESDTPHTFTINGQDIDEELSPGDASTVTVTVDAGKSVTFYCKFHRSSGMQGALFTKKGKSAAAKSSSGGSGGGSGGYGY